MLQVPDVHKLLFFAAIWSSGVSTFFPSFRKHGMLGVNNGKKVKRKTKMVSLVWKPTGLSFPVLIDLFGLYVLFSHFRPRDDPKGIFLLFFHKLCIHMHVHKTTFERETVPRVASRGLKLDNKTYKLKRFIIQHIVTMSKYGRSALNIRRAYSTDILRYT